MFGMAWGSKGEQILLPTWSGIIDDNVSIKSEKEFKYTHTNAMKSNHNPKCNSNQVKPTKTDV